MTFDPADFDAFLARDRSLVARLVSALLIGALAVAWGAPASAQSSAASKKACGRLGPLAESILDGKLSGSEARRLASIGTAIRASGKPGAKNVAKHLAAAGKKKSKQERAFTSAVAWCGEAGFVTGITTTTTRAQRQRAQSAFSAIAGAANDGIADLGIRARAGTVDRSQQCAEIAALEKKFARDLQAYDAWPVEAQDEIDALETAAAESAGLFQQCARGNPVPTSALEAAGATAAAAGAAARLALGLPIDRIDSQGA